MNLNIIQTIINAIDKFSTKLKLERDPDLRKYIDIRQTSVMQLEEAERLLGERLNMEKRIQVCISKEDILSTLDNIDTMIEERTEMVLSGA